MTSQEVDPRAAYRAHLIAAAQKSQEDYDKTLILLAGGALGLSLTFVKDYVGDRDVCGAWILGVAWCLLVLCLTVVLLAFYMSRRAIDAAIRSHDRADPKPEQSAWSCLTEALNVFAGIAFVSGVFLLATFVFLNL